MLTKCIPTARFAQGQYTHACVLPKHVDLAAGVEYDHRDVVTACSQPARQHGQLSLAAAHHHGADEEQHLHALTMGVIGLRHMGSIDPIHSWQVGLLSPGARQESCTRK